MALIDSKWEQLMKKSRPRNFPEAILFDILSRLPVKSILRFKSVCKKWYGLFGESLFIEAHMNRSIEVSDGCYLTKRYNCINKETGRRGDVFSLRSVENFEEIRELCFRSNTFSNYDLIATVGGIVCFVEHIYGPRYIFKCYLWNPATRELRILPEFLGQRTTYLPCLGFGFDLKHNDYKAVAITYFGHSFEVYVYSLRTDSWRVVEVNLSDKVCPVDGKLYVNDRMHWLWRGSFGEWLIVSFDFTEEKIIEMGVPEVDRENDAIMEESLASLGKSLILCSSAFCQDGFQVWFMEEYGDSKSWTKLHYIPACSIGVRCRCPLVYLDNGKIIMMGNENLVLYDPKNQVHKELNVCIRCHGVVKYRESLVSVKGGGSFSYLNKCSPVSNRSSSTIQVAVIRNK